MGQSVFENLFFCLRLDARAHFHPRAAAACGMQRAITCHAVFGWLQHLLQTPAGKPPLHLQGGAHQVPGHAPGNEHRHAIVLGNGLAAVRKTFNAQVHGCWRVRLLVFGSSCCAEMVAGRHFFASSANVICLGLSTFSLARLTVSRFCSSPFLSRMVTSLPSGTLPSTWFSE